MAIWQVPIRFAFAQGGEVLWAKLAGTAELSAILPEEKSWSQKIKQYGRLDSTCLEFYCDEGVVEEISARLDLRSITKQQVEGICAFAAANGLEILCEGKTYAPCRESFRMIVEDSDAHRFLADPEGFLSALKKE